MKKILEETAPKNKKKQNIRWDKLDNTALLFPVTAGEDMSNVYRISVTLEEQIDGTILQEALDIVLPKFAGFNLRMRQGVFWYYFEENGKKAPRVHVEDNFPCRFIRENRNNSYMFRVTYYKRRINLEVFHVLTDGMGGINFLKEITYQYLRLSHPELREKYGDSLSSETTMNREDSFLKNFQPGMKPKKYTTSHAFTLKGETMRKGELGVMHVYLKVSELKELGHQYGVSINELLVGTMAYSLYKEGARGAKGKPSIRIAVPVNLRPYFESVTSKNFFAMVAAELRQEKDDYTLEEVLEIIKNSLREQITKENMEQIFSYSVLKVMNIVGRAVPLVLKNQGISFVYRMIATANTTTVTNIGNIKVKEEYEPYVSGFHAFLAMSIGQYLKGTICSYKDTLVYSFSSILVDTSVEKRFCRTFAEKGLSVAVESNGAFYE